MSILWTLVLLGGPAFALGASFNLDFGGWNGFVITPPPSSAFGASAGQPGVWNQMTSGGLLNLVDLSGAATSAQISVTAGDFTGFSGDRTGDIGLLLNDNFFSNPGAPWVMTITGLNNGAYDFYYYAPSHQLVDTGAFTVNGLAAPDITGSKTGPGTVQGVDWQVVTGVTVVNGTLSTVWQGGGSQFTGLSGVQLVATPEPGTAAVLALGAGILVLRRKKAFSPNI